ncbi:MAG TPA: hypothetical protein VNM70_20550, partial [Burkholderiales bacterium]|nr:hypothetical protein [Burkholderiales bacterium]
MHRKALAAAVLRKFQRKSVIFPDASRTGDINTKGTPEEDKTDSKRLSRSLTRSSARARSTNTAALRAQMSAIRNSRSVGLRGVEKCTVSVPSASPSRLIIGVECTARTPSLRAISRSDANRGSRSV